MGQSVKESASDPCPVASRHTQGSTRSFLFVLCTVSIRSPILSFSSFSTQFNGDGRYWKIWLYLP